MTRLIDADALKEYIDCGHLRNPCEVCFSEWDVVNLLDKCPTIDAVPKEKILLLLNIAKEELSKAHANKSVNGIMTWSASVTTLEGLLKEYDTADTDIVPVIRCKDCVYFTSEKSGEHWNVCRFYDAPKTADGYCNDAERKEE